MSDGGLRVAVAVVAVVGVGVAGYLTYVHYAGLNPVCLSSGGCETVQSSRYAAVAGIPVALLGLLGYLAILASLLLPRDLELPLGAGLAMIGFGFSVYLTYREVFTIKAICQWCVGSAVLMTALLILTLTRALRAPELAS